MGTSRAHFYSPAGLIKVAGPDAATFLQGQFSQDLRQRGDFCLYGLWLGHKGKIKADSFILRCSESEFLVVSYFGLSVLLRENLESRIIMDEVETAPVEDGASSVTVWGGAIDFALGVAGLDKPSEGAFSSKGGAYAFWGRRGKEPCIEFLFTNSADGDRLRTGISDAGIQILDTEEVAALAIRESVFQVGIDILDSDLPQEVGLSELAVSYTKGCYIGQEVMARLKSMGRSRRSLECVKVLRAPRGDGPWNLVTGDVDRAGELRRVVEDGDQLWGSAMLKRSVGNQDSFAVTGQEDSVVERLTDGVER